MNNPIIYLSFCLIVYNFFFNQIYLNMFFLLAKFYIKKEYYSTIIYNKNYFLILKQNSNNLSLIINYIFYVKKSLKKMLKNLNNKKSIEKNFYKN